MVKICHIPTQTQFTYICPVPVTAPLPTGQCAKPEPVSMWLKFDRAVKGIISAPCHSPAHTEACRWHRWGKHRPHLAYNPSINTIGKGDKEMHTYCEWENKHSSLPLLTRRAIWRYYGNPPTHITTDIHARMQKNTMQRLVLLCTYTGWWQTGHYPKWNIARRCLI